MGRRLIHKSPEVDPLFGILPGLGFAFRSLRLSLTMQYPRGPFCGCPYSEALVSSLGPLNFGNSHMLRTPTPKQECRSPLQGPRYIPVHASKVGSQQSRSLGRLASGTVLQQTCLNPKAGSRFIMYTVYVYVYIYMYICMYVYIYMYVYVCICAYIG